MRRSFAFAFALIIPLTWAVVSNGCGGGDTEPPVEDACGFLGTDGNCAEQFVDTVGNACGAAGMGNGPQGTFLMRAMLDVCVLYAPRNGQVVFNPPLDPTMFPPASATFTMLNFDGSTCGAGSWVNDGKSFSVSIGSYPPDGGVGMGGGMATSTTGAATTTGAASSAAASSASASAASSGAGGAGGAGGMAGMGGMGGATTTTGAGGGTATTTGAGAGAPQTLPTDTSGDTLSITEAQGRQVFDLACGASETHHFDGDQLFEPACTFGTLMPHAELVVDAGGIDRAGSVIFRVFYEPDHATASSEPQVVEYFNCSIPPAPEPCFDMVRDGTETDVDCGGSPNLCITRCPSGGKCVQNSDCAAPTKCVASMGFKTCM